MTGEMGGVILIKEERRGDSVLKDLLEIHCGVTAVIGGGGKTTLLRTLGEELAQHHSVLLCTTTKIMPFAEIPWTETAEELDYLRRQHRLLCAGTFLPDSGKLTAPQMPMAQLAAWFDYILVEADGSAQRPLKAHAPHEPVIPVEANQTICVVGASGFGRAIVEVAHRPERYAALAKTTVDAMTTPETEVAVLLAERLHDRIFVNQVETAEELEYAQALAKRLACPVLAGSLWKGEYLVCSY